jgi:hypothetical protein
VLQGQTRLSLFHSVHRSLLLIRHPWSGMGNPGCLVSSPRSPVSNKIWKFEGKRKTQRYVLGSPLRSRG